MPPRDLASLLDYIERNRIFDNNAANLLSQWGPPGRALLGARFFPPRLMNDGVDANGGEIDRIHFYTVAAKSKSRHSPAPKVDGGQMFGSVRYKLGDSGFIREVTAPNYEAIQRYLRRNQSMSALAVLEGFSDSGLVQGLVEYDEFQACSVLTTGGYGRFGDNGYVELVNGPTLDGQFLEVSDDWSPQTDPDDDIDPWETIFARVKRLTDAGFVKSGIRILSTDQVLTLLKNSRFTATRAGNSVLVTNGSGVVSSAAVRGPVDDAGLAGIFRANGLQAPVGYDLRGWTPGHVQKRFYTEGCMSFVASTGVTEEVRWNQDDPAAIKVVNDVVGFQGIGTANGQPTAGRKIWMRNFTQQTDARLEGEATQTTGPVLMIPEALCGLSGITEAAGL